MKTSLNSKSTVTSTIILPQAHENNEEKSSAAKLYNFLSKSQSIRNSICSLFLFKPPKPKGYKFEKTSFLNGEIKYKFFLHTERGVYRPPVIPTNMELSVYSLRVKTMPNNEGIIPALYIKNNDCEDKFLVIYSHGNASDLGDVYEFSKTIAQLYKVNVLSYDYRGYGISSHQKPSEKSLYDDLEFVISFAQEKLHFELSNIILWGFSLGTGPTVELAARYQNIGGVILQSPLASVLIWLDSKANWDYAHSLSDMFCSINKIENIRAKIFIIHGKRDQTIDVRHSNLLYEKYVNSSRENNQIWLVLAEGVGHNDIQFLIEDEGGIFYKRVLKFIDLVKYPLMLRENDLLLHHRAKSLKEEAKLAFLEKERKSLKLSYGLLEVNEYRVPEITRVKHGVSQSTGDDECSKIEERDLFIENIDNDLLYKTKTHSGSNIDRREKSRDKKLEVLKEENEENEGKGEEMEMKMEGDLRQLIVKNYF